MIDFFNPSEDLLAGLTAGRNEKQDEVDALTDEIVRLTADLTALREAVIKASIAYVAHVKDPDNDAACDSYETWSQRAVDLADTTTGDTDHANR